MGCAISHFCFYINETEQNDRNIQFYIPIVKPAYNLVNVKRSTGAYSGWLLP